MEDDLQHCRTMIADQERLAAKAISGEAAEAHPQMAMLYQQQLERLHCSQRRMVGVASPPKARLRLASLFFGAAASAS